MRINLHFADKSLCEIKLIHFTLQGLLRPSEAETAPAPGGASGDWEKSARASGLRELTVEAQPPSGGVRRHKVWGQGSLEQVRLFAASAAGADGALWREFVYDMAAGGAGRLYVVLEEPAP